MRTTVVIDDQLFKRAKLRAAEQNTTLSEVINHALRDALSVRAPAERPFAVPTYGDPTRRTRLEPDDFKRMLETEDIESLRR